MILAGSAKGMTTAEDIAMIGGISIHLQKLPMKLSLGLSHGDPAETRECLFLQSGVRAGRFPRLFRIALATASLRFLFRRGLGGGGFWFGLGGL